MHGGFGRDSTYNNLAAISPDFKKNYSDDAPVSNADITPTLLYVTGIAWNTNGVLPGRVMEEALSGKTEAGAIPRKTAISESVMGSRTVLEFQEYGASGTWTRRAWFPGPTASQDARRVLRCTESGKPLSQRPEVCSAIQSEGSLSNAVCAGQNQLVPIAAFAARVVERSPQCVSHFSVFFTSAARSNACFTR